VFDMSEALPTYGELTDEVRELRRQLEALQAENARLRSQLDEAHKASKRQAAPFRKGPPKLDPKTPGRKSGQQHGKHGHRTPPPDDSIDETIEAHLPEACSGCGSPITETEVVDQFQTEIPRRPIHRKFHVHVGQCQGCGCRVQGRHPLQTSDAIGACVSQIGPDAQAAVVILNKEAGLSHGKIVETFDTLFGIPLTRGASAQIVLRAADRLEPAYQEIRNEISEAPRLTVDETGWRVGGQPAWLHAWVSERATCYAIDPLRRADALEAVIGIDWDGVLIHDGWSSYDRFEEAVHQQCLAHVIRRSRELLAGATRGGVHFPRQVIDLLTGAIHLRNEYVAGRVCEEIWSRARDEWEGRLLKIVNARRTVPEYQTLSGHLARHFESWFSFLTDAKLPATNWEAEQAIRPAVVNRKVWGGNRTESGARAQGILSSVLRTCRQQKQSVIHFVSRTLRAFRNRFLARPILLPTR